MQSIIGGIVRTLVTAGVSYAAGKGIDLSGFMGADVQAAVVTVGVTLWSIVQKVRAAKSTPAS